MRNENKFTIICFLYIFPSNFSPSVSKSPTGDSLRYLLFKISCASNNVILGISVITGTSICNSCSSISHFSLLVETYIVKHPFLVASLHKIMNKTKFYV